MKKKKHAHLYMYMYRCACMSTCACRSTCTCRSDLASGRTFMTRFLFIQHSQQYLSEQKTQYEQQVQELQKVACVHVQCTCTCTM